MVVLFAEEPPSPVGLLEAHSGELTILVLFALLLLTLLLLVPQLLRSHQKTQELLHAEQMRALEQGLPVARPDERFRLAGRTAALVPMVVVCAAGTVTCFLAAYRSENLFAVALTAWSVAGVVSLAAITGGVALMGRIAQLNAGVLGEEDEEEDEVPQDAMHP
jgi:hypothetical protein